MSITRSEQIMIKMRQAVEDELQWAQAAVLRAQRVLKDIQTDCAHTAGHVDGRCVVCHYYPEDSG
jgi:hypothetical protein